MTIYFGEKPVFLTDELALDKRKVLKEEKDTIYMEGISNYNVQSISTEIEKPDFERGIIFHENLQELKDHFFDQFEIIQAGGGLVRNEKGEILLIFRRGKWDLPKGKLDSGEAIEECAVREVKEETGLREVELGKPAGITYHTYVEKGTRILKESHWFEMKANSSEILIPQTEEDILEIKWVSGEELQECLKNTYSMIEDILELGGRSS